ncbi:hypothetical protein CPB85DRAFT_1460911 [Mucidula mucida]|nr:hypothetical protein CPB85DRAFT_1460911 [Mucidula mucida]
MNAPPRRSGHYTAFYGVLILWPINIRGRSLESMLHIDRHSEHGLFTTKRFHIPDLGNLGDIIDIGKTGIHWFDDYVGKDKGEDTAQDSRLQQSQPSPNHRRSEYCNLGNPIPGCVLNLPNKRRGVDFHDFHPGHWVWDETKKAAHFITTIMSVRLAESAYLHLVTTAF